MGLTRPRAYQIYDLDYKQAVRVVTTSNITLSGGAPNSVDGVSLSLNDRVLVTGQSTGSQNGIYYVSTVGTGSNGTWSRSIDTDATGELLSGTIVMVTEGNAYADTQWKLTTNDPITIGSTSLTFIQNYSTSSISAGTSNVVVTSNANVTISSAGTPNVLIVTSTGANVAGTLTATGRISGPNGSLSAPTYGFSSDTDSGMFLTGDGNVAITTNSGIRLLVNDSGANITGSINATSAITATGNVTGGNINTAGKVVASGIVSGQELTSTNSQVNEGGQINLALPSSGSTLSSSVIVDIYQNRFRIFEGGGTARGAYLDLTSCAAGAATNLLAGGGGGGTPGGSNTYVQFNDAGAFGGNGQFTYDKVTNTLTAGIIAANNNATGQNFKVGDDIWIGDINAADTMRLTGQQNGANAYIVFGNADGIALGRAGTGALTYGAAFTATGNITGGNLITAGVVSATGNISGGNLSGTSISGTLTTAAQTNITSVGTLGSLAVTGNITGGNANVAGRILVGSGTAAAPGITFSADVSQDTGFYWISDGNIGVSTNGTLRVTFDNAGGIVATGNISGGNLSGTSISGTLTTAAQTNITSVGTLGSLAVTGNITGGNANVAGRILVGSGTAAAPGITFSADVSQDTGFYWISDGNIGVSTNGTLRVTFDNAGGIVATGNISGGNLSGTSISGTLTTAAQTNITSVGTLGSLAVTGNTTSGNFVGTLNGNGANVTSISATNISSGTLAQARLANSSVTLGSTALTLGSTVTTVAGLSSVTSTTFVGALSGAATTAGTVTTAAQPNITSTGTLSSLSVTGNITSSTGHVGTIYTNSIINTGANGTGNIGSSTLYFNTAFIKATSAQYADLAEMYVADAEYAPGTVVEFGGDKEITITTQSHSTSVAGIISTNPSYLMNSCQEGDYVLPVALTGRVPCQVLGPVNKGDVLVSSHIPGVAQRIGINWQPGCVLGKSMEQIISNEIKTIEVAVGRL